MSDKNIKEYDNLKIAESGDIIANIDTKAVLEAVAVCGNIMGQRPVNAPVITVKEVRSSAVNINITSDENNIIGYKLEYGEMNEDNKEDVDEMKMDLETVNIDESGKYINYKLNHQKL